MKIRMKSRNGEPAGWLCKVFAAGCKASSGAGPFGRIIWVIKKDGDAVVITQSAASGQTTTIAAPSCKQKEIAAVLVETGIACIS